MSPTYQNSINCVEFPDFEPQRHLLARQTDCKRAGPVLCLDSAYECFQLMNPLFHGLINKKNHFLHFAQMWMQTTGLTWNQRLLILIVCIHHFFLICYTQIFCCTVSGPVIIVMCGSFESSNTAMKPTKDALPRVPKNQWIPWTWLSSQQISCLLLQNLARKQRATRSCTR